MLQSSHAKVCDDLKMIFILLGFQESFEEYPCSLCLWDSRADNRHYLQKKMASWKHFKTCYMQCKIKLAGWSESILLPSLHVMHLVKALNIDNPSFKFLQCKFPVVSDAELVAGMF